MNKINKIMKKFKIKYFESRYSYNVLETIVDAPDRDEALIFGNLIGTGAVISITEIIKSNSKDK